MPRRITSLLAILSAIAVLAIASSLASADRLAFNNGTFRIVWAVVQFEGTGNVECPLTLEGTYHSIVVTKLFDSLIGHVTRAATAACGSGSLAILGETLPWHVRYSSFDGTLPEITQVSIRIVGMGMAIDPAGLVPTCRFTTEAAEPGMLQLVREASGTIVAAAWDPSFTIAESDPFFCLSQMSLVGTGEYMILGRTTRVDITLI
jgi:hypothetical protein